MRDDRPDPDALLTRAREEEARQHRGKLKIFFGAAAGVGKTYAMLEAARAQQAAAVDVVVGWVETHGRAETEALLPGLERLPPRSVDYRGATLREFDLDAALARRPALILVDELAHTNAAGSRHAKRWQDVTELLAAGIDVYTTLNVQHLESLNDVVARVTGVPTRETVPDSIIEAADEVELVDLPPDELIQRLRDGKVYVPEQAGEAVRRFFRKGNLIALRELALRTTAARVDAQMEVYRRDHAVPGIWPVAERILVCVSPSPLAARVVRAARRMAAGLRAEWVVVSVETPGYARLPDGGPRPPRPNPPPRRTARRRDGHADGPRRACRGPRVRAPPQRHPHRTGKACTAPLARDAVRLGRERAGPPERRHRRLRHHRGARRGAAHRGRAACSPARRLARLRAGRGDRSALDRSRVADVSLLRAREPHHGVSPRDRARSGTARPGGGHRRIGPQRSGLRLLLRASLPVLRSVRHRVRGDLRGDAGRGDV